MSIGVGVKTDTKARMTARQQALHDKEERCRKLAAEGLSRKQIAARLGLTEHGATTMVKRLGLVVPRMEEWG